MKLWLLVRVPCDEECGADCCERWDVNDAMVVRAEDEDAARAMASEKAFGEGPEVWLALQPCGAGAICTQVTDEGEPGAIIVARSKG